MPENVKSIRDRRVIGIKLRSTSVSINGIADLVVARLVQASQIIPNLRDVRVNSDSTRISVECITVLVDLEIENADRAPKRRITPVTIDCLLISFVCLVVLLPGHKGAAKQIPALRIGRVLT
jgi:hypothetical protein